MEDKELAALGALAQRIEEVQERPIQISVHAASSLRALVARVEQHAARVAELEGQLKHEKWCAEVNVDGYKVHVAELEAALRPFAELAELFCDPERAPESSIGPDGEIHSWPRLDKTFVLKVEHLRAALLATQGNADAAPVPRMGDLAEVTDGWKLVPVQPTEGMVIAGFESEPDPIFVSQYWDEYRQMTGCQRSAFRAKLCWEAMLAAAPVPPVSATATPPSAEQDQTVCHAVTWDKDGSAELSELGSIRDSCDFSSFLEDFMRLSNPGLAKKQARIIRKSIIDTIDARVRNAVKAALATAHPSGAAQQVPQHVAYAENGVLHWMTGRKFDNCELYTALPAAQAWNGELPELPRPFAHTSRFGDDVTDAFNGPQMHDYARKAVGAALEAAKDEGWISSEDRLPDVPQGDYREFIIACKRGHNGKTYVFAADYLNAKLLQTEGEDCPEDGRPFTGWHQERDDSEYDTAWHPVCQNGDVVTHWMPLPATPVPAVSEPSKG